MKSLIIACATAAMALIAGSASAATFNFSYIFDADASVAGTMQGTVSSGILTVGSVAATITSTGGTLGSGSVFFDTSLSGFHISGNFDSDPGRLALDGSFFDLAVITLPQSNNCNFGLGFCLIDTFASAHTGSAVGNYVLNPASFSIAVASVPLPAGLPLLGGVLAAAALAFRRRTSAERIVA